MMISESALSRGSIWLTKFPFSDLRTTKIRPVVVLHHDQHFDDVLVAAISSRITDHDNAVLITEQDPFFALTGLRKSSVIRCNRQVTLKRSRLFHQLGVLSQSGLEALDQALLALLDIGEPNVSQQSEQSGAPAPKPNPYARQSINAEDVFAVVKTLRSDFLTQGPKVPAFEQAVANYCGARHAVAVNSGTSALHIACLALGLGPGDMLWTTPITFVASANCGLYCGAGVDFVDIDPRTGNMSLPALKAKLQQAETENRLPKIVIPVHLCGQPCDMQAIHALSDAYGFKIIEDASHALGARYQSQPIGNCRYSDITVFSFHPVKIITTGEGGMALTHDAALAEKMARLRSHGITRDAAQMTQAPDGPWYYEQIELGYNYRMTDLQAALGLSQLLRLDEFVARRRQLAQRYDTDLAELPLTLPWQHPDCLSAWHLYVIRLKREALGVTHREVFEGLRAQGIGVNLHYIPVHTQPYYRRLGFAPGMFPEAEAYYQEAITLPLFPDLTEGQQDIVVEAVKRVLF